MFVQIGVSEGTRLSNPRFLFLWENDGVMIILPVIPVIVENHCHLAHGGTHTSLILLLYRTFCHYTHTHMRKTLMQHANTRRNTPPYTLLKNWRCLCVCSAGWMQVFPVVPSTGLKKIQYFWNSYLILKTLFQWEVNTSKLYIFKSTKLKE